MNALFDNKIIIACSSGNQSNCAITVIRISGKQILDECQKWFSKKLNSIQPRKMYRSQIIDNHQCIDDIMLCFFANPNSYTGENVLELYVHGNILNVKRILALFCKSEKIRFAQPGEFTYRALKNKKISLTQAEGLDLLLNANNGIAFKQGLDILQGNLHKKFLSLYKSFRNLKVTFELQIDFLEDVGEKSANQQLDFALKDFESKITDLYIKTLTNKSHLLTPTVVVVGQTNAGKSSFFNNILGLNRSIVSKIKGTTRDYVSDYITIEENLFQFIDTAGIRNSYEEIEMEGIKRSKEIMKNAFFCVMVLNPFETDYDELKSLDLNKIDMFIVSHADCKNSYAECKKLEKILNQKVYFTNLNYDNENCQSGPIGPDKTSGPIGPDKTSGPIGPDKISGSIGPDKISGPIGPDIINGCFLKEEFYRNVHSKFLKFSETDTLFIERQRTYINKTYNKYLKFKELLKCNTDIAISISELSILENEISQLIGIISTDDLLGDIFKNFCIGK
ncbi:MAG: hypothetical protein A2381_09005 [Bdellovibrionales bacterium RIFOXYB1_FULL_37_110]|nr:MAG: hypothetical protein A2181_09195 [Bdellovibrionales bacterium RIFOXYA1_FULL_38_20]OFZ50364.1 MAG: hypothetical protein A2417_09105 [Bdellovibrionales bacterium RIFOXYC1_FULL_37_79]OFZ60973.1 MAG: hypothetical protein A2381_09005 [Bdellovibrionales bacterium RIFOXYB1_FULL_37_110]OFZ63717.1 MAG: hypothetical protein A2577_08125 [Bdellovibrionales bacterium RIFOXYD1_FULL_36_51]